MTNFNKDQLAVLNLCTLVASALGTLGALAIVVSYHISARFRTPIARIMYFNAYGDIMSCIGQIIGFFAIDSPAEHPICQYQAAILQTGIAWSVLGDLLIGISLFLIVVKHLSLKRIRKLNTISFITIAIISTLNGFVPLLVYSTAKYGLIYGHMMGWCWITDNYPSLQFMQIHLFIFIVFILNTISFIWAGIIYYRVYKRLQNNSRDETSKESAKQYLQRFSILTIVFTIIYIFCWISLFINRLLVFAGIKIYFMFILRDICTPLRGIFNLALFSVIAISTSTASPKCIHRESNVYKLHLISDDETLPSCGSIHKDEKAF
ncbi:hypothetical protein BDF19DRAFT_454607 [Syncephalis fuscata]|nr:hypothetical protein BDF19DRAFT_454607 [Syncephalis fuscata]